MTRHDNAHRVGAIGQPHGPHRCGRADARRQLTEIPAGRTESYGQLAARIGAPTAVRAVGLANGANPVGVIVPCHRVVGSSGKLTGYAGGLERKKWLLEHEGALKV